MEDEVLRRAHQKHGGEGRGRWVKMSKYFNRRDGKKCKDRWNISIKPGIKHQSWTPEEKKKVSISLIHF